MLAERFFLFLSGISYKVIVVASSLAGFVLGDIWTNQQWGPATLAGVIAGVFIAIVGVVPRIMEQSRKKRVSQAEVYETATKNVLERMENLHRLEVEFYKRSLADEKLIATLERNAKHDAITEWGSSNTMVLILQQMLREKGVALPPYAPKTYNEIVGKSDKEIKAVAAARVAESPVGTGIEMKS